jgi:peptidoglycan/xylan/chitin deacetylase (PgdA/CDA1 family)
VLFTHDDAIMDSTHSLMLELLGNRTLSGCTAAGTMFVTTNSANECNLMLDLHARGFEIADHTRTHPSLKGLRAAELRGEVLGAQEDLVACGVPEEDVVGLRAPFLESDAALRALLAGNGFLYDSSLIEEGTGNSLSGGMAARVWPFQSDEGIPINCDWFSATQECSASESLPGFWQVPVWQLVGDDVAFSMDYGDDDVSTYTVLKQSFDAAYGGNRAPFPIFGHTPWLLDRKADVKRFLGGWRCLVFGVCVCVDVFLGCVCGMGGSDERLGMSMGQRCPQKWRQAAGSSRLGVCTACVAP